MNKTENTVQPKPGFKTPIQVIFDSRAPAIVLLKIVLLLLIFIVVFYNFKNLALSVGEPYVYQKDFVQPYLLAKAGLNGINPYLPLPELTDRILGPNVKFGAGFPTPHPPPLVLLALPFGLLPYPVAATVWLALEIGFLSFVIFRLLNRFIQIESIWKKLLVVFIAFCWEMVVVELVFGQLMILLLALAVEAWLSLRSNQDIRGGIFIGFLVAIKLFAWPFVIFLIVQKRWRAVVASILVPVLLNVAAGVLIGFDKLIYYYLVVSNTTTQIMRSLDINNSLWTLGYRVFEGTGFDHFSKLVAPPLVYLPDLAKVTSVLLPAAFLIASLFLASSFKNFDHAFGLLICTSILVNPVAWSYYLVLLVIPMAIFARRFFTQPLPKLETYLGLLGFLLSLIPYELPHTLIRSYGTVIGNGQAIKVPFLLSFIPLLPLYLVLLFYWLIWRLDKIEAEPRKVIIEQRMPTASHG